MKQLPIGIQDFGKLRENDMCYVDKTEHLFRLIALGKYQFFARPRRFGKSLMLSTVRAILEGRKELFTGLWIEDKWDWQPRPVIYIDLNSVPYSERPFTEALQDHLDDIAGSFGVSVADQVSAKEKLVFLLKTFAAQGRKAAILIDEYDKPITDYLGQEDKLNEVIPVLKQFYGTLKSYDAVIHYALITGVSKFGKVSIFSDLNNLNDLSLDERFYTLCGYTTPELTHFMGEHLQAAADRMGISPERLWEGIRFWYNGYTWDGKPENSVYNPFSLLNFLEKPRFRGYWFETGTPTLLTKLLKKQQIPAYALERLGSTGMGIEATEISNISPISLLFQTGYLTVLHLESDIYGEFYTLGYPNEEVRLAFNQHLLAEYMDKPAGDLGEFVIAHLREALNRRDWDDFFGRVKSVFATVPYQIAVEREAWFHSIMHVLLTTTGWRTFSEVATNRGRMDTVLENRDSVFIFEFKVHESTAAALTQIHANGYPERFGKADKALILIGVAYDAETRTVKEWVVETN